MRYILSFLILLISTTFVHTQSTDFITIHSAIGNPTEDKLWTFIDEIDIGQSILIERNMSYWDRALLKLNFPESTIGYVSTVSTTENVNIVGFYSDDEYINVQSDSITFCNKQTSTFIIECKEYLDGICQFTIHIESSLDQCTNLIYKPVLEQSKSKSIIIPDDANVLSRNWILIILSIIFKRSGPNDHSDKRYRWNDLLESPIALAGNGYLYLLKQYNNKYPLSSGVLKGKSMIEIIKQVCFAAIQSGNIDIIKYYLEEIKLVDQHHSKNNLQTMQTLVQWASYYKKLDIFNYLSFEFKSNMFKWDYRYLYSVSPLTGCLESVKLTAQLCGNPSHWEQTYPSALDNAASVGNLEIIEWILQNRQEDEIRISRMPFYAIRSGHFHVIEYMYNSNLFPSNLEHTPAHLYLLDFAVQYNHIDIAKYFHSNPILTRFVSRNIYNLAYNSSVEMVQWLHTNRTAETFTDDLIDVAAFYGRLDIIQWLHKNTTATCSSTAMNNAATNGHLEVVKWLHFNRTEGCTRRAMDGFAKNSMEGTLWLHENRTEGCTTDAMDNAAGSGNFELLKWLHENRTEGCTQNAIIYAIKGEHYDIIHWLFENRTECNNYTVINHHIANNALGLIMRKEYNRANFEIFRWFLEIIPLGALKHFQSKMPPSQTESFGIYWDIIEQSILAKEKVLSPTTSTNTATKTKPGLCVIN